MTTRVHSSSARAGAVFVMLLAIAIAFAAPGEPASAAGPVTRTWTGAGANSNWNNNANWNPAAPNAGDILVFPEAALRKTNVNNFAAGTSFAEIRFEGAGYSISGNRVVVSARVKQIPDSGGTNTLALVIDGAAELVVNSGTLNVVAANLYSGATYVNGGTLHAGGSLAFAQSPLIDLFSGTLTLAPGVSMLNDIIVGGPANPVVMALGSSQWQGAFIMNDTADVDVAPGATFTVSGALTGSFPLVKTGPGRLTLSGLNSLFSGTIEVREGILRATRHEAFGFALAGTEVSDGATLELETMALPGEQIEIRGDGFNGMGALRHVGGISNIGNVFVADDARIRVDEGTLRLTNGLDGAGEGTILEKDGEGTLELEGNGNFDGQLKLHEGELAVRGTIFCDVVVTGGTVTGDGEMAGLKITAGVVNPGVDGIGTLTVNGNLLLEDGAEAHYHLQNIPQQNSIRVNGLVHLEEPKLVLSGDALIPLGASFLLIQNDGGAPILGGFDGIVSTTSLFLNGRELDANYEGGAGEDLVLTRVGEPYETSASFFPIPATIAKGSEFEVTFLLFNFGPSSVTGAFAEIPIRPGLVFLGFDEPAGWDCDAPAIGTSGGVLACYRENWAPTGPTVAVEIPVRFLANGAAGALTSVKVFLGHAGDEGSPQDNTTESAITIGPADPFPYKLRLPFLAKDGAN